MIDYATNLQICFHICNIFAVILVYVNIYLYKFAEKMSNSMGFEDSSMRERIIKLIHREGISQREFANRIGRRPPNLSKILNGELNIPRGLANEILNVLMGLTVTGCCSVKVLCTMRRMMPLSNQ